MGKTDGCVGLAQGNVRATANGAPIPAPGGRRPKGERPLADRLTERERSVLHALVDAFVGEASNSRETAAVVEELLADAPPVDRGRLRTLLRVLHGPLGALVHRDARRAASGHRAAATALLRSLRDHRMPALRGAYQALKRLSLFVAYAGLDEEGANPNWEAIGFTPPPPASGSPRRLAPVDPPAGELSADVVVVGSGAGGGLVAAALAQAGRDVLVIEQGEYLDRGEFDGREASMMPHLYLGGGTLASRDLEVILLAGGALGGGTLVNWMASIRAPEHVLQEWAQRSGIPEFAAPAFQEHYGAVEERLGVRVGESPHNRNNLALLRGLEALGLPAGEIPRNARGCEGRCGACGYGCPFGGKQSVLETYLQDATAAGARILVRASVQSVEIRDGHAQAVLVRVRDASGQERHLRVRAGTVVLAAGALGTPAILLRSRIDNPLVGRNLHLHPATALSAVYPEPVRSWEGSPMSVYSDAFARLDGGYGVYLETAPGHPGLIALACPWDGAEEHRALMMQAAHMADLLVICRDREGGRLTVDRDGRPRVDYRISVQTERHLREGIRAAADVAAAGGAQGLHALFERPVSVVAESGELGSSARAAFRERILRVPLRRNRMSIFSAHQMGGAAIGGRRAASVVRPDASVWGVRGLYVADASLFPAATGVNPMLTVMALAHRVAQELADGR